MTNDIILTHRCFLVIFVLIFLPGCASQISGEALRAGLDGGGVKPAVVDVRTKGEFESGYIPEAVNISVLSLPFNMDRVPVLSRDQKVVVYCAHGPRAVLAGFFLRVAGFTDVYHLKGDFGGWHKSGYPIKRVAGD